METFLNKTEIASLEQRKRTALVNSVSGFKSLNLIGTMDPGVNPNLAIFNSVFHLGANPALVGFIVRPDSAERHTLANILSLGYYTINHVNTAIYRQAHQTAARYPKGQSEFEATGLNTLFQNGFPAPFVKESQVRLGMKFRDRIDIAANNTILIVGEITQLYFPSQCWCDDGYLDIEKAGTVAGSSLDGYHRTMKVERLSYAKPDRALQTVPLIYTKETTTDPQN